MEADYPAQRFVFNSIHLLGAIVLSYRTAKNIKAHIDVAADEVDAAQQQASAAGQADRAAATTPSRGASSAVAESPRARRSSILRAVSPLVGRRPGAGRQSTAADRLRVMQQQDARTATLLQFWVLYGMVNFLASMDIIYAVMLRALLVMVMLLPEARVAAQLQRCFYRVAGPLMSGVIPYLVRRCVRAGHRVKATAAPFARVAAGLLTLHAVERAPTEELLELEAVLKGCRKMLVEERRARRFAELQQGIAPAGSRAADDRGRVPSSSPPLLETEDGARLEGDYLDDDEVAPREAMQQQPSKHAATTDALPGARSVDTPGTGAVGGGRSAAGASSGGGGGSATGRSVSAAVRQRPMSMAVFSARRVAGGRGDDDDE